MLIAQTGNLFPMGPSKAYGGERVVYYLCDGLVKRGHRVVFFGTEQNEVPPGVEHVTIPSVWRSDKDPHTPAIRAWEAKHGSKFDIFQCNYFGEKWDKSCVDEWNYCELVWCAWCHTKDQLGTSFNTISCSKTLRDAMNRGGRFTTIIPYGIPMDLYSVDQRKPEPYVVWIGKIEGGKGLEWAIDCARKAGVKIVVMGPPYNSGHFVRDILPRLGPDVIWVRGASDVLKAAIFRRATAFLSANVDGWQELFGIVNIEAMASGCPVIGWSREGEQASAVLHDGLIEDGKNGFLVKYRSSYVREEWTRVINEVSGLIGRCASMDRSAVRATVETNYSQDMAAKRYEWYYQQLMQKKRIVATEIPF